MCVCVCACVRACVRACCLFICSFVFVAVWLVGWLFVVVVVVVSKRRNAKFMYSILTCTSGCPTTDRISLVDPQLTLVLW